MDSHNKGPIRILHIFGVMALGGVPTWLVHMMRHLDRERFRMDFLVFTDEPGILDEEIRALGGKVIPCSHPSRPWIFARNFKRVLRQYGPYDVVHCHSHFLNGFFLWLAYRAGIPGRISHSHMVVSEADSYKGLARRGYMALMRRLIHRYATKGVAGSRQAAADLFGLQWEADPRIKVINYSVDLEGFRLDIDRAAVHAELGIPKDAFVIGHVGRFDENKNQRFIVAVAAEVAKQDPKMYLLLVGEGPLRQEVQNLAMEAGLSDRAVFTGRRRDVPQLMLGAMDLFIYPSVSEGLGNARLEAQAAGLPCVVSDSLPGEGNVVKALIKCVSLSESAHVWAEAVLALKNSLPLISQQEALRMMEESPFSTAYTVKELEEVYLGK